MRTALCLAVLLFALPAFAAENLPADPPAPPAVNYDVWGFQWNGQQYVKQATQSFSTTDIKQAADYAAQVDSFVGWAATTNLPDASVVHTVFHGRNVTNARPTDLPAKPNFAVWAFRLTDGKWAKDDGYSWTTTDPAQGLAYAAKVNAVAGWRATTNCPAPLPPEQRYVNGGTLRGSANVASVGNGIQISTNADGGQTINFMGITVRLGPEYVRNLHANSQGCTSSDSFYDDVPANSDNSDIQNMIDTQDMINQQQMNDNTQDMINTQNFNNTEQMINDQQNAINAQNLSNSFNQP